MSHRTTRKVQFRNLELLKKASEALGLEVTLGVQKVDVGYGNMADCVATFRPKGWFYLVAVTCEEIVFDNMVENNPVKMQALVEVMKAYANLVIEEVRERLGALETRTQTDRGELVTLTLGGGLRGGGR